MSTGYLCVTIRLAMAVVVWLAWSSSARGADRARRGPRRVTPISRSN